MKNISEADKSNLFVTNDSKGHIYGHELLYQDQIA